MVSVDNAVIARLRKAGHNFEIMVDCEKALDVRKKGASETFPNDVIASTEVFSDIKKGEKASENIMKEVFGDVNINDIFLSIINEGEIQLTSEYKNKLREEKKKRIVDIIHRNAVDNNGIPHPPERILRAMEEAKVGIDEFKKAEEQVDLIILKLRPIIPLRIEVREIEVIIPSEYAGKSYSLLKKNKLIKEEWLNNGSLSAVIEIPAGLQEEFEDNIMNMTKGNADIKILRRK